MFNSTFCRFLLLLSFILCSNKQGIQAQDFEWANQFEGSWTTNATGIARHPAGWIATTGHFNDTIDLDPGPAVQEVASMGFDDAYLALFDTLGDLVWAHAFSSQAIDRGAGVAFDSQGNIYFCGRFGDSLDVDPGSATTIVAPSGSDDCFLVKFNLTGELQWYHTIGGTNGDIEGIDLSSDGLGHIYLTGHFTGDIDTDLGPATNFVNSIGTWDSFISRFDTSGTHVWQKLIQGPGRQLPRALTADSSGNVYAVGVFGDSTDFDPGPGSVTLVSWGSRDGFVVSLDSNGDYRWSGQVGGPLGGDYFADIGIGQNGELALGGNFSQSADLDPGPGIDMFTGESFTGFLIKMDTAGNRTWSKTFGGNRVNLRSCAMGPEGKVYASGYFRDTIDLDPGPGNYLLYDWMALNNSDGFMVVLDSIGDLNWGGQLRSDLDAWLIDLEVGPEGRIAGCGSSRGKVDFDPGADSSWVNGPSHFIGFVIGFGECPPPSYPMIFGDTAALCAGDTLSLGVGSSQLNGPGTWAWYANTCCPNQVALGDSVQLTPLTNTTYFVQPSQACLFPGSLDSFSIQVNPAPVASYSEPVDTLCTNSTPIVLGQAMPTGGSYSGSGVTGNQFDPVAAGPGGHFIVYSVVGSNGCIGADTSLINVSGLMPTLPLLSANDTVCQGDSILLSILGGNLNGAANWQWYENGCGSTPIGQGDSIYVTPLAATTYFAQGLGGCAQAAACDSLVISTQPYPTVVYQEFDSVCSNAAPFLLSPATPAGGTYAGPGVTGLLFDPFVAGLGGHWVSYSYTDSVGCTASDSQLVVVAVCLGLDESQSQLPYNIAFDPGTSQLRVEQSQPFTGSLELVALNGLVLKTVALEPGEVAQVGLGGIASQVLLLRVKSEFGIWVHRLFVP